MSNGEAPNWGDSPPRNPHQADADLKLDNITDIAENPAGAELVETKRGPGRPRKNSEQIDPRLQIKKLDDENKKLRKMLENAMKSDDEAKRLKIELEHAESEALDLKARIIELETENVELVQQLIDANQKDTSTESPKPRGVVIYDRFTKPIAENLKDTVSWSLIEATIEEISKDSFSIPPTDVVLMITGLEDFAQGANGVHLFKKMITWAEKMAKQTQVAVVNLPQTKLQGPAIQIKLFNYQLKDLSDKRDGKVQIINMSMTSRSAMTEQDSLILTDDCVVNFTNIIHEDLVMPVPRQQFSYPVSTAGGQESTTKLTELVQINKNAVGAVIGRKGFTIRELSTNFNVSMTVGKWLERIKGASDEYAEKLDGVLISGAACDVRMAANKVAELAVSSRDKENKEPVNKKIKL